MRSWKMALAFGFAFGSSETFAFAFKYVDAHLLTSLANSYITILMPSLNVIHNDNIISITLSLLYTIEFDDHSSMNNATIYNSTHSLK